MKRNILKFICGIGLVCALWSCENGNQKFDDYEGGTTVYFPISIRCVPSYWVMMNMT